MKKLFWRWILTRYRAYLEKQIRGWNPELSRKLDCIEQLIEG